MELDDVYDDATLARIERASAPRGAGARSGRGASLDGVRRAGAGVAIAAAALVGAGEAIEPPRRERLVAVDPWEAGGTHPRVRFHWHPVPWLSVAEVLW